MPSGYVVQSALAPAGIQSSSIHHLWLLMLWVSAAVFVVVLGFLFAALIRGMRRERTDAKPDTSDKALRRAVAASVALTVIVLFALLVASVWTGRTIASLHASSADRKSVV